MQTRTQTQTININHSLGFDMPFEVEFNASISEWFEKDFAYGEWATERHVDIEPNIISITFIKEVGDDSDYTDHKEVSKQIMDFLEGQDEDYFE